MHEARPITLTQALLRGIVFWLLWVVSSPLILWLARTFPIPRREWLDGLLFHTRRIHLLVRPPAPLRGHFVAAEQGSVAPFDLGDARRISTRLPLELRLVEPDLLDDPPRELRLRLLPPLPGGAAQGLEVGNGVGAITARGAEDAVAPAFSLQHAPFDFGVDARGR